MTREEVVAAAEAQGLKVRHLAEYLYFVEKTWLPVIFSFGWGKAGDQWQVRRQCNKRWKTVYRGKSLDKALQEAKGWLDPDIAKREAEEAALQK